MSNFEAELRLPAKQPYAYINIVVRADSIDEMVMNVELLALSPLAQRLTDYHANAAAIVMSGGKVTAEVKQAPKPQDTGYATQAEIVAVAQKQAAPQAAVFQEPNAEELIKQELGGKVVSETEKKPWEQAVTPAAQPWQKSQSSALADW